MKNLPIPRHLLTTAVVKHLATQLQPEILVGRGVAPKDGGWVGGQPGSGLYNSYITLRTGRAITPAPGEPNPIGRVINSWSVSYRMNCFGAMESHAGDVADRACEAISTLEGPFTLKGVDWVLQQVVFGGMSDIIPNNSTDPPYWQTSADVSLHLSRVRAR